MLNYLLEVTVCWGVFYLIYALLLSRQTFFATNRWYLLITLALGLLIPLLEWQPSVSVEQHPIVTTVEPIQLTVQQFEQIIVVAQEQNYFNWWNVLLALYWLGVGVFTLRFGHGLWKIWQVYRNSEVRRNGKYRIVYTDTEHLPYSFFNCLFWSKKHEASLADQQQILRHEEAHISGWHTLDVLWMEILSILFWCSPMIYLYRASMRNVHEYLADAWVLQTTNKRTYGHLLLSQSLSGFQIALASNFINSQLKKRIIMMTRHESPRHTLMRYMWLLPIVMLTFLIFSKKENRKVLKAQVELFSGDFDLEKTYKQLDKAMTTYDEYNRHQYINVFIKMLKTNPDYAHQITMLAQRVAMKYGKTFVFECKEGNIQTGLTGGKNILDIDVLPRFSDCDGTVLEAEICAERKMHQFIEEHYFYSGENPIELWKSYVFVTLYINENGWVTNSECINSDMSEYQLKAITQVREYMPKWIPAQKDGEAVACKITVPFFLNSEDEPTFYTSEKSFSPYLNAKKK